MIVLRYLYALALVVWLGGMLVIGAIVAPSAFDVLPQQQVSGRLLAGALVGDVLRRFQLVSYGAGVVLLVSLTAMKFIGPRPAAFGLRAGIIMAMLALALVSGIWVTARINRLQQQIGVPASTLDESDPRRAAFGRLHGLSTTLMLINMIGGLVLLIWEARE
ncbi:MAG: DUF4149 domain-containing protein [Acidobacteria bacterium]|nr:DUF4149 domain-containing protein [Acidobacteriota bacterium]MBI3263348.1 DUF4149 domain-containing protein [Acidobacteriota bacterium]